MVADCCASVCWTSAAPSRAGSAAATAHVETALGRRRLQTPKESAWRSARLAPGAEVALQRPAAPHNGAPESGAHRLCARSFWHR